MSTTIAAVWTNSAAIEAVSAPRFKAADDTENEGRDESELNLSVWIVPAEIFPAKADQRDEHRDRNTADHMRNSSHTSGEELTGTWPICVARGKQRVKLAPARGDGHSGRTADTNWAKP